MLNGWNDGVFKKKLTDLDISFYEVKLGWIYITKPLWTLDSLVHYPAAYRACKKIFRDFDPDIIHFCGYSSVIALSPLLKNRNCVYNLQEDHLPTKKHLFIYRLLNKHINLFTTVSECIVNILVNLRIPRKKIRLIYNGVPVLEEIAALPRNNPMVFGIIGQVASWKGHETLIDATAKLALTRPGKFVIIIFGNDQNEYAAALRAKIRDDTNVDLVPYFVWKGFVKEQDAIYSQVDVVVVPSLSLEPCSLSILESMMRGKIIIASDRGGNVELIDNEQNGFIFRAEDPDSLAATMQKILDDGDTASMMANNARRKALTHYTSALMEENYGRVYSEIAG